MRARRRRCPRFPDGAARSSESATAVDEACRGGLVVLGRSPLYSPLAVVLVGGLVSSMILARVVTPVLYKLLAPSVAPTDTKEEVAPRTIDSNLAPAE